MKPNPLNEKQAHFLKDKIIPFLHSLEDKEMGTLFSEGINNVLKDGEYDHLDRDLIKLIIEMYKHKYKYKD